MRRPLCLVAFGCALALALAAASAAADLDLADPAAVAKLEADLAGDDFAVREDAQKRLQSVLVEKRDVLQRVADAAKDPEARARLSARADQLHERAAIDPPGITLTLKDADLPGVTMALATATGKPLQVPDPAATRYTLQADHLPFWEVYRRLHEQNPFWFAAGAGATPGIQQRGSTWERIQIHHGFAVFSSRPRFSPGALPGGPPINYGMELNLGVDPRIDVITAGVPEFTQLVNERGQGWNTGSPRNVSNPRPGTVLVLGGLVLNPAPEAEGKSLTVAGVWPVQIAIERKTVEIADLSKPPAGPLDFGDVKMTLGQYTLENRGGAGGRRVRFTLSRTARNPGDAPPAKRPEGLAIRPGEPIPQLADLEPPLDITMFASDGKVVRVQRQPVGESLNVSINGQNLAKLVLSYPVKTRIYKVPFEFKDLPVTRLR